MPAQEAAWQLGLERVVLLPVGMASHKLIVDDPGAEVRLELTRVAVRGNDLFEVSALETKSEQPAYTHETLEQLAANRPGDELVLIVGADQAAAFPGWADPRRVLELASLAIAPRPPITRAEVLDELRRVDGAAAAHFIDMGDIPISSTLIRERVRTGHPIRYLVPEPVFEMIEREGLYR